MEIVKNILSAIYIICAVIIVVLAMLQTKEDPGMQSTVTTASENNYVSKNKNTTQEGRQKTALIGTSIFFVILNIVLGIVYML